VKRLFIALAACLALLSVRAGTPLPADAKIVTAYLFTQCDQPLRLVLVASDGSSQVFDLEHIDLLMPVIMSLPKENRLRVTLPKPLNGCPVSA
jgi:hypothetical protein